MPEANLQLGQERTARQRQRHRSCPRKHSSTADQLSFLSFFTTFPLTTNMPPQTYFLVSVPTTISPSNDREEAVTALQSAVSPNDGSTSSFAVPEFKIGTLDALVQQADDLAKLEQGCHAVVDKVVDSLRGLLDGDEDKLQEQKVVNDRTSPRTWNALAAEEQRMG